MRGLTPSPPLAGRGFTLSGLGALLVGVKRNNETTIDHLRQDKVFDAGFRAESKQCAKGVVQSFERFIEDHKDEITALQVLYNKPYKGELDFEDIKELADPIQAPPNLWTESLLWQAYAALENTRVKGAGGRRILTDLVYLVRFAIHRDNETVPFPERRPVNFYLPLPGAASVREEPFTEEQLKWLHMFRDRIAGNFGIEPDDFEYGRFAQEGGFGRSFQLLGDELLTITEQLHEHLAA